MLFIGDVHCRWNNYSAIINGTTDDTCQIGDFGVGFVPGWPQKLPAKDRFIRGNHDNPELSRKHPNYLGEYGFVESCKLFFVSGAWSIDRMMRIPGVDWWADEQLGQEMLTAAIETYRAAKPAIVATHECPTSVFKLMKPGWEIFRTRTGEALQQMLESHVPDVWIFGHHHVLWKATIESCQFICLDELSTHSLPDVKWSK